MESAVYGKGDRISASTTGSHTWSIVVTEGGNRAVHDDCGPQPSRPSLNGVVTNTTLTAKRSLGSPHSGVRLRTRRICRWCDGKMVLRCAAAALVITGWNFRKPSYRTALRDEVSVARRDTVFLCVVEGGFCGVDACFRFFPGIGLWTVSAGMALACKLESRLLLQYVK